MRLQMWLNEPFFDAREIGLDGSVGSIIGKGGERA